MGSTCGSLSFSYLGVPILRGAPRTCHLTALADSIISKFSKWKGHSLSLAGHKCMINFVIAASLVHSMMVYYWPRTLLKKIENAMRNFLWTVGLTSTINDYFYDEQWHFDYDFFMKHTYIVRDILSIHVSKGSDSRVWGNLVSGQLTSSWVNWSS
ncbi:hypothetical protein ACS0TY_024353 [Phlomoides rotata]